MIGYSYRIVARSLSQRGLHALDHDPAEQVGPAVVRRGAQAGSGHGAAQGCKIRRAVRGKRREKVDAGVAFERVCHGQALGIGKGIGVAAPEGKARHARPLGCKGEQCGTIQHQALVAFACPIPFEHRELGVVQRTALAVAIDSPEAEEPRLAGGQQLLAGEFG